jgi:hypothetical protein
MMPGSRDVPVDPHFGGFVIETLTIGMYEETKNAIREYIQNGFDSIQRAINKLHLLIAGEGLIRIIYDDDGNGLRIRDNGAGLVAETAVRTLTSIGESAKDFSTDAGFRGIGRLAGIAFCDVLTFTTKADGEAILTEVVYDAAKMRGMMAPGEGSKFAAVELLKACVTARQHEVAADAPPFFEVSIRNLIDAPAELTSAEYMEVFVGQVSPVGYRDDFPLLEEFKEYSRTAPVSIETVKIVIEEPGRAPRQVFKPYGAKYAVQGAPDKITLSDHKFYTSPTNKWWAWIGKKDTPGSYLEEEVRGIRMRAKNIQIDGTAVVREIFQRQNKSNGRYQDWFIGEIFVDPKSVVPNARRDGFEDDKNWKLIRGEIGASICKDAGTWAQEVSDEGQLTLEKLTEKTNKITSDLATLRKNNFRDTDRTINVSAAMTKLQAEVGRASRNAEASTLSSLQALNSELLDMKREAMGKLAPAATEIDTDKIENEARDLLLGELMALFEQHLELPCLNAARAIVRREFGWPYS